MRSLQNHPFAVETSFDSSLVLTFAIAKEELAPLIPPCLQLDTFNDQWAFLAIALVQTRNLRPKGFPRWMGKDFFLAGFRVFVRYTTNEGRRLRGLCILKSETNKRLMSFFGNIFTHYSYNTTDILFHHDPGGMTVYSKKSGLEIEVAFNHDPVLLPDGSPFGSWKEARRFAGPLPFTFSFDPDTKKVLIIEGVRQNWIPELVTVKKQRIGFIEHMHIKHIVPASAFLVRNIPYYWKKGKTEIWIP